MLNEGDELIDAGFRRGERGHQANQDIAGWHDCGGRAVRMDDVIVGAGSLQALMQGLRQPHEHDVGFDGPYRRGIYPPGSPAETPGPTLRAGPGASAPRRSAGSPGHASAKTGPADGGWP